jgi:hypothetical protein
MPISLATPRWVAGLRPENQARIWWDLLVSLLTHIHRPMNTLSRLFPFDLSGRDLDAQALASVTVLNRGTSPRSTTAISRKESRCHGMTSPGASRSLRTMVVFVMKEDFVGHCFVGEGHGRVALRLPK